MSLTCVLREEIILYIQYQCLYVCVSYTVDVSQRDYSTKKENCDRILAKTLTDLICNISIADSIQKIESNLYGYTVTA